jgi:hypothetical protein
VTPDGNSVTYSITADNPNLDATPVFAIDDNDAEIRQPHHTR